MTLYRDEGVVLRTQKLGEADRIVTLLTRRHGKVRAVAKGVRRTKSKFGSRLEPFTHVDLQCYQGRELDIVTQAEIVSSYAALSGDYGRYTAGTAMLETVDRFTEEREPALRLFLLLAGALKALDGGGHDASLVLDAFVLRTLSISGYAPGLDDCARCGADGPHRSFHVSSGGLVCPDCRPSGSASPSPGSVALMSALLTGDWATADATDRRTQREASGLVSAYLEWHLDRRLRSMQLVER
ncbi:MAG TPA: DNA repair protein RecO [Mycobacteriales bacterium]|nr:DNA repair protein RecO [Mycobacteriales bacterium]